MSPGLYVTCSFALNCGIPMALAVRELFTMGPTPRSGRPDGDVEPPHEPTMPPSGLPPEIQKPLPECLIPRLGPQVPPVAVPEREVELV